MRKQALADIREIPIKHRSKSFSDDEERGEERGEAERSEERSEEHPFVKNFNEQVMKPLSEREVMEAVGEIPPVLTKAKRKRRANKVKEVIEIVDTPVDTPDVLIDVHTGANGPAENHIPVEDKPKKQRKRKVKRGEAERSDKKKE